MSGTDSLTKRLLPVTSLQALVIFWLSFAASVGNTKGLEGAPHIRLVTFDDPPHILVEPNRTHGLSVTIIERLFELAGLTFDLQVMPPKRTVIYTTQQKDVCVFPIERNQEREALFSWIGPILVTRSGLYTVANTRLAKEIQTLQDAKPYVIGSHLGSGTGEYLESLGFTVDFIPQNVSNIYKLDNQRIELWETDQLTAEYASQLAEVELSTSHLDFFTNLRAIACNPAIPKVVIEKMRSVLYEMHQTGEIERLQKSFNATP